MAALYRGARPATSGSPTDASTDQLLHLLIDVSRNDLWVESRRLGRCVKDNDDRAAKRSLDLGTQTAKPREQIELVASIGVEHLERALTSIVVTDRSGSGPDDRATVEHFAEAGQPFIASCHAFLTVA
jgi:hypothetical protein